MEALRTHIIPCLFWGVICPNLVLFFTGEDLCQNPPMCPSLLLPAACGRFWHKSTQGKNNTNLGQITRNNIFSSPDKIFCQNTSLCPSLLPPAACGVICLHFILLWHFSHLHFAWAFETEGGIYVGIKNRTFAPSLCISVMLDIMLTISIHSTGYENSKHVIQNRSTK